MLRLIKYLKGNIKAAVAGPLFKLLEAAFELIVPLVVASIIDNGISKNDTSYIYKMCAALLGLGVAGFMFSLVCQYLAARASLAFGTNVRRSLYSHINKFDFASLDKFGAPSLITRLTNDVNQTQQGVAMFIRLVLRSPFIAIGATIMAVSIDAKLSLVFLAMALVVGFFLFLIMSRSRPYYHKIQKNLDTVALLARENLSGTRVVRAFSRQAEEERDFKKESERVYKTARTVGRISGLLNPLTFVLVNIAVIAILYFGKKQVYAGDLTQGQILALVNYLLQIQLSLVVLANLIVTFTKSSACAKRINEVLDTVPALTDEGNTNVEPLENSPKIVFENAGFSYGSNAGRSLDKINLAVMRGQTIGIIGATGSGKTTLINLIGRFYDVSEGAVKIDGTDVKAYPFNQLRDKIGYVMQGAALFYGTVRDNIRWGKPDATDEEIWHALKISLAAEFVETLKDGLDTIILQGGKNLSGGQRQRLTIARALVKEPEILILDDSSSALDYATDAALRRELKLSTQNMTVIIVSQRSSSIKNADQILVLDEGKQIALGTHENLLNTCALYNEICSGQAATEGAEAL